MRIQQSKTHSVVYVLEKPLRSQGWRRFRIRVAVAHTEHLRSLTTRREAAAVAIGVAIALAEAEAAATVGLYVGIWTAIPTEGPRGIGELVA